ncbi:hypothetical protein HDU98_011152 [Podochytrium sp. JEL0797]|nr:hypothetical protein HDU98_011152 [Podochytrium sp. JEL0797]
MSSLNKFDADGVKSTAYDISASDVENDSGIAPAAGKVVCGIRWTKKLILIVVASVIVVLVAIILIVIFVAVPKIAQHAIDGSAITLQSTFISNPTDSSFHLLGSGQVSDAGPVPATLTFPDPIAVAWTNRDNGAEDLPLGTLWMSPVAVSSNAGVIEVDTVFNISSQDNFALFATSMINSAEFSWLMTGAASAKSFGLTMNDLSLSKVVTMSGFNGMQDITINAFDLPTSDPINGIDIKTTSTLVNPSTTAMAMGDVQFDLFDVNNTAIGFLRASDLTMVPGANTIPMTGSMRVDEEEKLSNLMNTFLLSGNGMDSIIVGNSSSHSSKWLNSALQQLRMRVVVPSPILEGPIVSDLVIPAMSVSMNPSDPTGMSVFFSAPLCTASFSLPYNFPLNVTSVQQTLDFIDMESTTAFATLTTEFGPSSANQSTHLLTTAVSGGSLVAIPGQEAMFAHFMAALTFVDTAAVNVTGQAVSKIITDAGDAQISLPLTDVLPLQGFQGFQSVTVVSTKVVGGDKSGIRLQVDIVLNNPSTLSLRTNADVTMGLEIGGVHVGLAVMPQMQVVPGPNPISAEVVMAYGSDESSRMVLRKVMSGFVAGESVQSSIVGSVDSIVYDSLKPAFSKLTIPAEITGPKDAIMVVSAALTPGDAVSGRPSMNVFTITNPLDASYTLLHIQATVSAQTPSGDIVIGTIDYQLQSPVTVAPHTQATTEPVPLIQTPEQYETSVQLVMMLLASGHDTLLVNAKQVLTAAIGTYPVILDYQATGVPVHVVTPIEMTTLPSQVMCTSALLIPSLAGPTTNVFTLANPLPAPYTLTSIQGTVTVDSPNGAVKLGTMDYTLQTPVTVKPGESATTEPIPLIQTQEQTMAAGKMILQLEKAGVFSFVVNAEQTLSALVGGFEATVRYGAVGIPVEIAH